MRINLPITQREFPLSPNVTLVSVTDIKGRITYCNPHFVEVSGYSTQELLGQPHNIIRHPDMPEEAFRDLWATLEEGKPWTGLVKNRRKNGDHYWVRANATPMRDGDRITGYLSVRTVPAHEEVQAAEQLYAAMRAEAHAGGALRHVLRRGHLVERSLRGRCGRWLRPGIAGQLMIIQLGTAGIIAGLIASGLAEALVWAGIVLAALGASALVHRQTVRPLHKLVRDVDSLAGGDLTHEIETSESGPVGELKTALRQLSVNLQTIVQDVSAEIDALNQTALEIAAGNADLSERTSSQAASIEETAASIEEIAATVQSSAHAAAEGVKMAQETSLITGHSNETVQAAAQTMAEVAASSQRIDAIIELVANVAFQTNLLSLNAAVEAARAGDAGRGFAVVAGEVRSLAQRTSSSAREIRQLIQDSNGQVRQSSTRTREAMARMRETIDAVAKMDEALNHIHRAAEEQHLGIRQINEAMSHLETTVQQNAAMVEELAEASHSLQQRTESVIHSTRLLRLRRGAPALSEQNAVTLRRQSRPASLPAPADPASPHRRRDTPVDSRQHLQP